MKGDGPLRALINLVYLLFSSPSFRRDFVSLSVGQAMDFSFLEPSVDEEMLLHVPDLWEDNDLPPRPTASLQEADQTLASWNMDFSFSQSSDEDMLQYLPSIWQDEDLSPLCMPSLDEIDGIFESSEDPIMSSSVFESSSLQTLSPVDADADGMLSFLDSIEMPDVDPFVSSCIPMDEEPSIPEGSRSQLLPEKYFSLLLNRFSCLCYIFPIIKFLKAFYNDSPPEEIALLGFGDTKVRSHRACYSVFSKDLDAVIPLGIPFFGSVCADICFDFQATPAETHYLCKDMSLDFPA